MPFALLSSASRTPPNKPLQPTSAAARQTDGPRRGKPQSLVANAQPRVRIIRRLAAWFTIADCE